MKTYKLFCDSNCELWYTKVEELGLEVIRMPYTLNDVEYFYDMGKETNFKEFFDAMRAGAVPKTSALNKYAYLEYFEPVLKEGLDIFYITFSHKMSATFNAMDEAIAELKEKYPDRVIRTVDTKAISLGAGFMVYYAALKYNEGASMDELEDYVKELVPHTATYFAVEDLTYLYRGGRVSGVSKVIGGLLGIKPILYFNDEGKILNIEKAKGFKKALASLLGYMKSKASELDKYKVMIVQADNEKSANELAENIKAEFKNAIVEIWPVGPVIGAHAGPGTVGVIFHCNER